MDLGDALEALLPLNVTASECVGDAWLKQHDSMLVKEHQVGSHAHETISRDTTHMAPVSSARATTYLLVPYLAMFGAM